MDDDDTPASAGTDTAHPHDTDTAPGDGAEDLSAYDYADDTPDADDDTATDAEDDTDSDDPGETTPEETPPEPQPARADATAKVVLADGTETTVGELAKGHLRQRDYTAKTQELAERRREVEATASRIDAITEAFVAHISGLIPEPPDHKLALSDPQAYVRRKAQHEAAVAQAQTLMQMADQARGAVSTLSESDQRHLMAEESRLLVEAFPETATQEGRQRFWDGVSAAGMELGFSAEELAQIADHRVLRVLEWARKGLAADKAAQQARTKVAKAPPVAPQRPGQSAVSDKARRNAEAMRRLSRSGSLRDAMAVDVDI